MTANKSIDGLVTRDAKKSAAAKHKPVPKKIPVKTAPESLEPPKLTETSEKPLKLKNDPSDFPMLEIDVAETDVIATEKPAEKPKTKAEARAQAAEDFLSPVQAFDFTADGELTESKISVKDMKQHYTPTKEPTETKKQKPKKSKKPKKTRKIIASIALVIVLTLIAGVLYLVFWGNDIIAKITGGQGNLGDLFSFLDENYDPLKTDDNGRTNILLFGTEGYDMDGNVGDGTHDGSQLTDSIMVVSLNQETGDVVMISLPRDLYARPTCTATGKINEVYWCNNPNKENEEAGATALMNKLETLLGLDLQYYAHLNWGSLTSLVDTLGGIEVTLDEDISDYYYTGAVFEAGKTYTIDGGQALGLARARHGTAGGDFSRGASQQKIIIGIKNKIFEKDLSLTDILSFANILGDNLRTNFSMNELKSLAHLTYLFDFDNMRQISLYPDYVTTGMLDGISFVYPKAGASNYSAIQKYITTMLSNDPRVYEAPTIAILNATDTVGLASEERTKLEAAGYDITTVDNVEGDFPTGYTLYSNGEKPGTTTLLEEYYHLTATDLSSAPVSVSRDYDLVLVLNPAPTTE